MLTEQDGDKGVIDVFESEPEDFCLAFEVDVFDTGEVSTTLLPNGYEYVVNTPDDLSELANSCDKLQAWLDECSTVLEWAMSHRKEIAALC